MNRLDLESIATGIRPRMALKKRARNIKDLIHRELIVTSREITKESGRLIAQAKKLIDEMRSLRAKIKSRPNRLETR